jgi:hypothetical protein
LENTDRRLGLSYPNERVIGYLRSATIRKGSVAYVTTERIIVNKAKGELNLKAHFLTAILIAFAPYVATIVAIAIFVGVVAIILGVGLKRRRSQRKWPSMKDVEAGIRLFEVRKGQVLSIELGRLGRFERGHVKITSLSNEVVNLTIVGKKAFSAASSMMTRFEPNRVRMD